MADITMPQLGETVTEGTITRWLKQVGDRVEEDEVLFEVSTDKVDSEVPSPVSGYLAEILVPEGETVDVGARLAVVSDEPVAGGGDGGASGADVPEAAAPANPATQAPAADVDADAGGLSPVEGDDEPPATTVTEEPGAPEQPTAPSPAAAVAGEAGRDEAERARMPDPAAPVQEPRLEGGDAASRLLSPVVRRLISEHGLDPAAIKGTGVGGRITRADVLDAVDRQRAGGEPAQQQAPAQPRPEPQQQPAAQQQQPAPARPAPQPAPTRPAAPTPAAGPRDEVVPFSNIRRRTAEHMVRSLQTSAHTLVAIEVDYENVDKVRRAQKDQFRAEEGFGLSYLPFVAMAVVDAVRDFPHVNASVGDDELIVHRYVNLGIAVDLNFEGLMVPVVHDADQKRMRALAREMASLAERARSRKLTPDDISGGTFTITNAGGYGTLLTGPIINQPQVAILSTDGVKPQPVAVALPDGTYGIAVHPVGNLAISFDHRAFDGAYASAFLARIKEILETRDWATEL